MKGIAPNRLALLGGAAVLLLSTWIQLTVLAGTEVVRPIRADAKHYVSYAWNLREFGTFSRARTWQASHPTAPAPDKLTLPGYPAFLTLFLDGKPDQAFVATATTAQALLGVATCWLVLLIALRILPVPWALAAGLLTATSPHLATINTYLLTEGLFCFLLAGFTCAMVRTAQAPGKTGWWLASAVLLAIASHVRPQLQPLPIVLLLATAISPTLRRHWPKVVAAVLLFSALMAPWQLRNAGIYPAPDEPDLFANSLYHGGYPDFMYRGNPASFGIPYRYDPEASEHGKSAGHAIRWIRSEFDRDPAGITGWYLAGKPVYFLSWSIVSGIGDVFIFPIRRSPYLEDGILADIRFVAYWLHGPLTLLGVAGMLLGAVRPSLLTAVPAARASLRALSILLLTTIVVHMIGAPFPRYGIPFRWLVYLLAMFPLARMTGGLTSWIRSRLQPSFAHS